jgi:hypothetical protein
MEHGAEAHQRMITEKLAAGELASTQVVGLPPVVRLSQVAAVLRGCSHSAFPVTPDVDQANQAGEKPLPPFPQRAGIKISWHLSSFGGNPQICGAE